VTAGARSERGDTLIEVLVSVVILGLAATAFLLGMSTDIGTSNLGRGQATGETLLVSAGEAVKDQNINPYACADLPTLQQTYSLTLPGGPFPPTGWQVAITDVEYWDPLGAGIGGAWEGYSSVTCPATAPPYPYSQGITVSVTSPDHQVNRSRTYVKVAPP